MSHWIPGRLRGTMNAVIRPNLFPLHPFAHFNTECRHPRSIGWYYRHFHCFNVNRYYLHYSFITIASVLDLWIFFYHELIISIDSLNHMRKYGNRLTGYILRLNNIIDHYYCSVLFLWLSRYRDRKFRIGFPWKTFFSRFNNSIV